MDVFKKELESFIEFENFHETYKTLPSEGAIYLFLYSRNIERLKGASPILKIGETKNLKKRMARYFNEHNIDSLKDRPNRQTAYRLRKFLDQTQEKVTLWHKEFPGYSKKCLRCEEKKLLKIYLNEHFETPPLNMGMS
jgi:hypothetical protein